MFSYNSLYDSDSINLGVIGVSGTSSSSGGASKRGQSGNDLSCFSNILNGGWGPNLSFIQGTTHLSKNP